MFSDGVFAAKKINRPKSGPVPGRPERLQL